MRGDFVNNFILLLIAVFLVGSTFTACQKAESDRVKPAAVVTPADTDDQTPDAPDTSNTPAVMAELVLPNCEELNDLWIKRYHQKLKAIWPLKKFACTGPSKDRAFAEAAYILENTKFRFDGLPEDFAKPPVDMLGFVTEKYNFLMVGKGLEPSTDVWSRTLIFHSTVIEENGFAVVGNLIHEARHADGEEYLHVRCVDGPNKDLEMCDNSLEESFYKGGPHSAALLYFAWVVARSNWPEEYKKGLKELTQSLVEARVNATPEEKQAWINKYLVQL